MLVSLDNLPKHFSKVELATLFNGYPIDLNQIKVTQPSANNSRGIVKFLSTAKDSEIDSAIQKVNGTVFGSTMVICKRVSIDSQTNNVQLLKNVVQIDHLTADFSYFDIKTLVEQFGHIVEIRINKRSRQGFVEFTDEEAGCRVVKEAKANPPRPPQCPRPLVLSFAPSNWKSLAPSHELGGLAAASQEQQHLSQVSQQQQQQQYYYPGAAPQAQTPTPIARNPVGLSIQIPQHGVQVQIPISPIQPHSNLPSPYQASRSATPNWKQVAVMETVTNNSWKEQVDLLEKSNKAYVEQNKNLRDKIKNLLLDRNVVQNKVSSGIVKYKKLEQRYVDLREKLVSYQRKSKGDSKYEKQCAILKEQNEKLKKQLADFKKRYEWLERFCAELKEQSEDYAKRFGCLRAVRESLCPYCSQQLNEAELNIDFLPRKRKRSHIENGAKRRKLEEDAPEDEHFGQDVDHVIDERSVDNELKEYRVRWASGKASSWLLGERVCPVLIRIWNRDKNGTCG